MTSMNMNLRKSISALVLPLAVMVALVGCAKDEKNNLINNPATASNAEGSMPVEAAEIKFKETEHNFGTVTAGDTVRHTFSFTNTGKGPLVIATATASCGCTVPDYPREPIAPGGTGEIAVVFNTSGKLGEQNKTVTVTANTNPSNTELLLKGKVLHPATEEKK